ncbi:hypothetical protein HYV80_07505 [Candidatus Woesearchaeota archaeon]|nr:hypothetical protein [Candidatus Woesearchaeota archaeon]
MRESCKELLLMFLFVLLFVLISSFRLDFLIWLVNVPLLILVYGKPVKKAALLALPPSILAVALSVTWVTEYSWSAYILSSILVSGFFFLFAVAFSILARRIRGNMQIFAAPFVYSILMILFSFSVIGSYWADWSMFNPAIAPLIWIVGSHGITFLIILANSMIAFYILKRDNKILAAGIVLALVIVGSHAYSINSNPDGQKIKVALLQGNFNQGWEWRALNAKSIIFDAYENMTIEAAKSKPALIAWPEYAIADEVLKDKNLTNRLSSLARKSNAHLVVGALRWHDSFYRNERERNDIALVFGPDGRLIGEYNSVKPVPFEKWVLPGNETKIFTGGMGNFGVSLCYEETQSTAKDLSLKGAQFLVSLANNQILDETSGLYLTGLYPNLRAAENGKYLIRATNTGITKIVNPYGKTDAQLEPYTRGILVGDIYLRDNNTFYTKYGDVALYSVLIVLFFVFVKQIYL